MKLFINLFLITMTFKSYSQENQTILAKAELNKKFGCIDLKGNEVIPVKYDDIGFWGNNLIPVNIGAKEIDYQKEGGKWGYYNNVGILYIPLQFDMAETFSEGIAAVKLKKKWGFIDSTGKIIIDPIYDEVRMFKEGLCAVSLNKKWGFINRKGEEMIDLQYGEASEFEEGIASVFIGERTNEDWEKPKGYYCLINNKGDRISSEKWLSDNFCGIS
jgi:WG containing repeat